MLRYRFFIFYFILNLKKGVQSSKARTAKISGIAADFVKRLAVRSSESLEDG
jgi:hypothetical protein